MTAQILTLTPKPRAPARGLRGQLVRLPISTATELAKLYFGSYIGGRGYARFRVLGFRPPLAGEWCLIAPGIPCADMAGPAFCAVNQRAFLIVEPV